MTIRISYAEAKKRFAELCDEVANDREVAIITRQNSEDVALVTASEPTALLEAVHLLKSPNNAKRLLTAMKRVRSGEGVPQDLASLKGEIDTE